MIDDLFSKDIEDEENQFICFEVRQKSSSFDSIDGIGKPKSPRQSRHPFKHIGKQLRAMFATKPRLDTEIDA